MFVSVVFSNETLVVPGGDLSRDRLFLLRVEKRF